MNNLKDKLSNYAALLVALVEGINIYLQAHSGQPFDWKLFLGAMAVIVIGYLTGKAPNATTKTN